VTSSPTPIGVAIVQHDGQFLVGLREASQDLAGYSEFPGGKNLAPESTAETAIRECEEETGLRVNAVRRLDQRFYSYEHADVLIDFWLCELAADEKGTALKAPWRWVDREELNSLNFPPANSQVLEEIRSLR